MSAQRQMHLIAFLMTGPTCHHHGAWRHPESAVDDLLHPGPQAGIGQDDDRLRAALRLAAERTTSIQLMRRSSHLRQNL